MIKTHHFAVRECFGSTNRGCGARLFQRSTTKIVLIKSTSHFMDVRGNTDYEVTQNMAMAMHSTWTAMSTHQSNRERHAWLLPCHQCINIKVHLISTSEIALAACWRVGLGWRSRRDTREARVGRVIILCYFTYKAALTPETKHFFLNRLSSTLYTQRHDKVDIT